MERLILAVACAVTGAFFGMLFGNNSYGAAVAQFAPPSRSGDALWHLPKFGDSGWFIHASDGQVRACNMDQARVVGERMGPRCSTWE